MSSSPNLTLPSGVSNDGDPDMLCLPANWTDVVIFFLGNYLAHAATVRTAPGISTAENILRVLDALLFPVSGIARGIDGILSLANFAPTDLQKAARAGALCKVIKTDRHAQSPREMRLTAMNSWVQGKVHGRIQLPDNYGLAIVHKNSKFKGDDDPSSSMKISSDFDGVSIILALGQIAFAVATLYRSRGDQIKRYGYAAYALTVIQYALMSVINLMGNLISPQYDAVYLVESQEMQDARKSKDAIFEGCVGEIVEDEVQRRDGRRREVVEIGGRKKGDRRPIRGFVTSKLFLKKLLMLLIAWIPTAITLAIIARLSHFRKGSSTPAQRGFTMAWLAVGSFLTSVNGDDILQRPRPELALQTTPIKRDQTTKNWGFLKKIAKSTAKVLA